MSQNMQQNNMRTAEQETAPNTNDQVIINYRDVGWSVAQSYVRMKKHGPYIVEKTLYRSGSLNEDEPNQLHRLLQYLGIRTVLQLSSDLNFRTSKKSKPTEFPTNSSLIQVQVGGGRFKRDGVWKPASNETKRHAVVDVIHGNLKQIKQRFSKQVLNRKGLGGMYIDYAETSAKALKEIFEIVSDPARLPVLIHCEQGKDRTGVVIAMILSACGVDRDVILDDYSKSREGLDIQYEDVKDEMNDLGLKDEFARTEPEALQQMFTYLEKTHGSLDEFLINECQLTPHLAEKLRIHLVPR